MLHKCSRILYIGGLAPGVERYGRYWSTTITTTMTTTTTTTSTTRAHTRDDHDERVQQRESPPTFAGGDRAASQPRCRRASSSLAVLGYSFSGRVRSAFRPARNWCDCPWGSKANGCHGWSNWHGSTGRAMYVRMCVCSLARAMSTEHRGGSSPSDEKWWRRGRRYDSTSYAYYHCY